MRTALAYRSQYTLPFVIAVGFVYLTRRRDDEAVEKKKSINKIVRKTIQAGVLIAAIADGVPTYFAADIAYHYNKFAVRGFSRAIDVWGADHHGHVARMKGAMDAIGLDGEKLDIVLMQFVRLMQDG